MKNMIGVVGLVLLSIGIASGELRTWTDSSGKHKIEAQFVALEDGKVTLRGASGKIKKIPLENLSKADQKIAGGLAAADKTSPSKAKPTRKESIAAIKKLGGRIAEKPVFTVSLTHNTKITDAGLAHLKGLTGLQYLGLTFTHITDAGLVHLEGLTKLQTLRLEYTHVTGAGLIHLKGLTNLRKLSLTGTVMTDAGLEHLKGLTKLVHLNLSNTEIIDPASAVTNQGLKDTEITDAGLEHLKSLTKLESLDLSRTEITDAGLAYLNGLSKLQSLKLTSTKVTDVGVKKIQAALPKCMIFR